MFKILLVIFFISELHSCSKNAVLAAKKQSNCAAEDGEWACKSGACIQIHNLCDGTKHCRDGSDERKNICKNMKCSTSSFRCNYGACIPAENMCDGVIDCVDSSDEDNDMCRSHRNEPTEEDIEESENRKHCASWGQMKCWSGQCVNLSDKCNGIQDCADGSDEWSQLCANILCDKNKQFKCNYGACIDIHGVCNGTEECADKSDEASETCEMKTVLPTNSSPPEFTTKISVDSKTTIKAKDNSIPNINNILFQDI
ncbi:unnamed protein product [Ceratitis capitata]|uniref:(Mediterranean fruit fly) hypothetical protein n=1 Tax=Ceratitis capitata TaxID=7213 RepID=A0A811UAW7_CERCA|nr:unnamed protein product [Ceratitis capitata]